MSEKQIMNSWQTLSLRGQCPSSSKDFITLKWITELPSSAIEKAAKWIKTEMQPRRRTTIFRIPSPPLSDGCSNSERTSPQKNATEKEIT